jgi:hypothetical protein
MLMQSKYFNSAFNSAIFDGPLRIYFAQFHESLALKLYFLVQQKWPHDFSLAKEFSKNSQAHILLMVYPTPEAFDQAMGERTPAPWVVEHWNQDLVIALRGPIADEQIEALMTEFGPVMQNWKPLPAAQPKAFELTI